VAYGRSSFWTPSHWQSVTCIARGNAINVKTVVNPIVGLCLPSNDKGCTTVSGSFHRFLSLPIPLLPREQYCNMILTVTIR
jgi:hypothetical protein